jgi:hypothetical protein
MKPESAIKQQIKEYLDGLGAYWFMPVQMGYGVSGTPDFLCCINGRFVGIETKAPGKRPSKWQQHRINQINKAGGVAFWTDNLEYTRTMLKAAGL